MALSETLRDYIAAAFTGLWVQTHEPDEALKEITGLCQQQKWSLASWDIDHGLQIVGASTAATTASDPLAAVKSVNALSTKDGTALLVLKNFHRFLQSAEMVQAVVHQIQQGKINRTFLLVLSPIVQIPIELEKLFIVIEHDLPDRNQLQKIAKGIATEPGDMPGDADLVKLLDAASGLTRYEAEGAFSLSLVQNGKLTPQTVWDLKTKALKKSGLLTLHRGHETFADLGGLDQLKTFCKQALTTTNDLAKPRGVLLLSPPGCGKSQYCKALGNETGRPTLILDIGSLLGSLVGDTERNVRQALRLADAMSPCVLMIDEVEKALSGSSSSTDSGVSARLFGTFLTWLSDHTSDVFVVCTANDVSKLPPEFSRAERFDGVFFLDLPTQAGRALIWPIYLRRYGLKARDLPEDRDWTGAEIASCCRLAAMLDISLKEAAKHVVPVAVTAAESLERLRIWASGRCLSADDGGIYHRHANGESKVTRKLNRASTN
jgi:hypothetical protein